MVNDSCCAVILIRSNPLRKLCAVPIIVRLIRALYEAGLRRIILWGEKFIEEIKSLIHDGETLGLEVRYEISSQNCMNYIVISTDFLVDKELIKELLKQDVNTIFFKEINGNRLFVAGILQPDMLNQVLKYLKETIILPKDENYFEAKMINIEGLRVYYRSLRRELELLALPIISDEDLKNAAKVLIRRTQKGLHFTSSINKYPENAFLRLFCNIRRITPNKVTIISNITAYLVAILFILGKPIYAMIFAFLTSILDGVDGKLARVRGIGTRLGEIEHSFDMLYEQIIYVAWIYYVYTTMPLLNVLFIGFLFLVSDTFTRHVYMQFKMSTGKNLLLMSKFDRMMAKIDGRRNVWFIYMLIGILTIPFYGLLLMLFHSIATSTIYVVRAIYHLKRMDLAEKTVEWLKLIYESS